MIQKHILTTLEGQTVRFDGNGRKFGYPTANIHTKTDLADGVYFGYADLANYQNHPALIFIGVPITLANKQRRLEAHLLDIVDENYYDEVLRVKIVHYHRVNKKFKTLDELTKAMHSDEQTARLWFAEQGKD